MPPRPPRPGPPGRPPGPPKPPPGRPPPGPPKPPPPPPPPGRPAPAGAPRPPPGPPERLSVRPPGPPPGPPGPPWRAAGDRTGRTAWASSRGSDAACRDVRARLRHGPPGDAGCVPAACPDATRTGCCLAGRHRGAGQVADFRRWGYLPLAGDFRRPRRPAARQLREHQPVLRARRRRPRVPARRRGPPRPPREPLSATSGTSGASTTSAQHPPPRGPRQARPWRQPSWRCRICGVRRGGLLGSLLLALLAQGFAVLLVEAAHDGRLDGGRRGLHVFTHVLQGGQDDLAGDSELLGKLVDSDSHSSPSGVRPEGGSDH